MHTYIHTYIPIHPRLSTWSLATGYYIFSSIKSRATENEDMIGQMAVNSDSSVVSRKIWMHLDLVSIPQSGGGMSKPQSGREMSKRLGGIVSCKDKTSSWYVNGSPDCGKLEHACFRGKIAVFLQLSARTDATQPYPELKISSICGVLMACAWFLLRPVPLRSSEPFDEHVFEQTEL